MKRLIISGALCAGWGLTAHAQQGLRTWIEELAALRALEQTVKTEYTTVATGLQSIGNLRADEYRLHQVYYGSLETVSAAVGDDPKIGELGGLLQQLKQRLNTELNYWRNQTPSDKP